MIGALANHVWQSTAFVLAAALVAAALRKNGAHIRHRIWVVASLKFLVPFSVLMSLGGALPSFTPAAIENWSTAPALSGTVDRLAQPFTDDVFFASPPATAPQSSTNWTAVIFAGMWACGCLVVGVMRLRGWRRIRAAVRASVHVQLLRSAELQFRVSPERRATEVARYDTIPVRSSPGLLEPGVVGLFRPVLLVPAGIEHTLTSKQLDAVLAHELCHVRRRDNLTSAIHMVVEALFWFHPLVWFVGARLIDERERACDEHVLRVCGDPQVYAESILNVCKLYVESPLACVSGVTGSNLKKRIEAIMTNRAGLQLSLARKVTLAIAAVAALGLPVALGAITAPLRASAFAQVRATADGAAQAAAAPKFDVASVKSCETNAPGTGGRAGGAGQASPDYLHLTCLTLRQLVLMAYAGPDNRLRYRKWEEQFVPGFLALVKGGPSWAYSERFTIEAKAEGIKDREVLTGPMLRALLEDRFRLKIHRDAEERSMLALTVAKTGLKIQPTAAGSCNERDPMTNQLPTFTGKSPCGMATGNGWGSSEYIGVSLGDAGRDGERFADHLWRLVRSPIIDRTGLNGRYTFKLEFTPDDTTPGVNGRCGGNPGCIASLTSAGVSDARPENFGGGTIFKALEQLGLKLEETKAPAEYIVIDHAERPRPDSPSTAGRSR